MTNMEVYWQSSFLEAIGPLAGIADPVTAIAKLSADAKMTAEASSGELKLLSLPLVTGDGMPGTSIENDTCRL